MSEFDKVIGYEDIKTELKSVRDGNFQPTQVERISPIRVN